MRVILLTALILCTSSSVTAITEKEQAQYLLASDSIQDFENSLEAILKSINKDLLSWDTSQYETPQFTALQSIKNRIFSITIRLNTIMWSFIAYIEGARYSPCILIGMSDLIKDELDLIKGTRVRYKGTLDTYFENKIDSTIVLVESAWLYVRDNAPDSCLTYEKQWYEQ